jgi:hypothetical protein
VLQKRHNTVAPAPLSSGHATRKDRIVTTGPFSHLRTWACAALLAIAAATTAAHAADEPDALARTLLDRYYAALPGEGDALAAVLGDAFQTIRIDGSRLDREEYLAAPSTIRDYTLEDIRATLAEPVLTVTYFVSFAGIVQGTPRETRHAPRIAVFVHRGEAWKLEAFASLGNTPAALPDASDIALPAVEAWVGAVASGDPAVLASLLAPEFQLVRDDGSSYGRDAYLAQGMSNLTAVPVVSDLVATAYGDLIVARYMLSVAPGSTAEGEALQPIGTRLTVFRRSEDVWLVVAHANFATGNHK